MSALPDMSKVTASTSPVTVIESTNVSLKRKEVVPKSTSESVYFWCKVHHQLKLPVQSPAAILKAKLDQHCMFHKQYSPELSSIALSPNCQ